MTEMAGWICSCPAIWKSISTTSRAVRPRPTSPAVVGQNFCQFRGARSVRPRSLPGEGDTLYHQKPDGTFEDVEREGRGKRSAKYYGFSSAFVQAKMMTTARI